MRINHRLSFRSSLAARAELAALGVEVADSGFVGVDVGEDHPRWPDVRAWMATHDVGDMVSTTFTRPELDAAPWLEVTPDWHHGYPEPDDGEFGYLRATYDTSDYCEPCGTGLRQVAPFQMKGEPKWGRRGILQLNWVFDEYFTTPEVWSSVFEPVGVTARPVLTKKGAELTTVVQLVVQGEVDVATDGLGSEQCPECGRTKYLPVVRGPSPLPVQQPDGALVWSRQWFGSGASAHHMVIASPDVRARMEATKVRGASFRPMAAAQA